MQFHFKSLGSTLVHAIQNIDEFDNLDYITCDYQTNGYGVSGKWEDSMDKNFFYTVILEEKFVKPRLLPFVVMLSVVQMLKFYNLDIKVKLPNDIFYDGKKLSGFLIDKIDDKYIVGVGVNVHGAPEGFTYLTKIRDVNYDLNSMYSDLTKNIANNLKLTESELIESVHPYIGIIGKMVNYRDKATGYKYQDICKRVDCDRIHFENGNIEIIRFKQIL